MTDIERLQAESKKKDSVLRSMMEAKRLLEARTKDLEAQLEESNSAREAAEEVAKVERDMSAELDAQVKVLSERNKALEAQVKGLEEKVGKVELEQLRAAATQKAAASQDKEIASMSKQLKKRDALIKVLQDQLAVLKEENHELRGMVDEDNDQPDGSGEGSVGSEKEADEV